MQTSITYTIKALNTFRLATFSLVKTNALNILGLKGAASFQEIKQAYFHLSKKYHPDLVDEASHVEKFKEIGEAYNTLKMIFKGEQEGDEMQSFTNKRPHFNSYDGKLHRDDLETFKKYQKSQKIYDFCDEKSDLKKTEEEIYKKIFGKSYADDPSFFYAEKNSALREEFEHEMDLIIQKEEFNLSNHEQKNAFLRAHKEGRRKFREESMQTHEFHEKIGKMFKQE